MSAGRRPAIVLSRQRGYLVIHLFICSFWHYSRWYTT